MYVIENTGLKLTLQVKSQYSSRLRLQFVVNGSEYVTFYSDYDTTEKTHNWSIPLSNWHIGDILTNFRLYRSGTYPLSSFDEGIDFILDNETKTNLRSNNYTTTFTNTGEHSIQAVFRGNHVFSMAKTDKVFFFVEPEDDGGGGSSPTPNFYRIEFVDMNRTTFKYKEGASVKVRLLKGGEPQADKLVEMTSSLGYRVTGKTLSDGTVYLPLGGLRVGKHKLNATFTDDGLIQCSCQADITVEKNDPLITYRNDNGSSTYRKMDYVLIRWQEPDGLSMNEQIFPVYVNGTVYNCLTNVNGRAWIRVTNTGTFRFKAIYYGNENMNPYEKTFTINVVN